MTISTSFTSVALVGKKRIQEVVNKLPSRLTTFECMRPPLAISQDRVSADFTVSILNSYSQSHSHIHVKYALICEFYFCVTLLIYSAL